VGQYDGEDIDLRQLALLQRPAVPHLHHVLAKPCRLIFIDLPLCALSIEALVQRRQFEFITEEILLSLHRSRELLLSHHDFG
jgi:hypothetical protein